MDKFPANISVNLNFRFEPKDIIDVDENTPEDAIKKAIEEFAFELFKKTFVKHRYQILDIRDADMDHLIEFTCPNCKEPFAKKLENGEVIF